MRFPHGEKINMANKVITKRNKELEDANKARFERFELANKLIKDIEELKAQLEDCQTASDEQHEEDNATIERCHETEKELNKQLKDMTYFGQLQTKELQAYKEKSVLKEEIRKLIEEWHPVTKNEFGQKERWIGGCDNEILKLLSQSKDDEGNR